MSAFRTWLLSFFQPFLGSSFGKRLINWMLLHMNDALPLERIIETDTLMAFFHPKPAYPFHVLIVPRQEICDMLSLTPDDSQFMMDVITTAQQIVNKYHLNQNGYRLILNGGTNQDFPLLHFHLIADVKVI